MPRGKSCTVSNCHVAKTMPLQCFGGARDLFQTNFFCKDVFRYFFRDENQNMPKLQGRKTYLSLLKISKLITGNPCNGTKIT